MEKEVCKDVCRDVGEVSDGVSRRYGAEQVVLVECGHIREMRGETDEVIRRTRDVASENAVLNAVRSCGVEPDWFVERWVECEGKLVACAVFEDAGKCAGFRGGIAEIANRMRERGEACPVRVRDDAEMGREVAELLSAEWERRHAEQMGRYAAVMEDVRRCGGWEGRVLVGEYRGEGADAKRVFAEVAERLNAAFPHDAAGEGGIAYSGYWDEGGVARFCFGMPDEAAYDAAADALDGIGARFFDPVREGCEGVEMEMAALVIAKMQGEERARAERGRIASEVAEKVADGVRDGIAADAAKAMD